MAVFLTVCSISTVLREDGSLMKMSAALVSEWPSETNARRKKSIRKFNQQVNQTFEPKSVSSELELELETTSADLYYRAIDVRAFALRLK